MTSKSYTHTMLSLLDGFSSFQSKTDEQKAAYRAQLTRIIKLAEGSNAPKAHLDALYALRDAVGASAPTTGKTVTADEIVKEFETKFPKMNSGQQGAFKAKVTRRINVFLTSGDQESANKLLAIQSKIAEQNEREHDERLSGAITLFLSKRD